MLLLLLLFEFSSLVSVFKELFGLVLKLIDVFTIWNKFPL